MFLWSQPPLLSLMMLSSLLRICGALHPFLNEIIMFSYSCCISCQELISYPCIVRSHYWPVSARHPPAHVDTVSLVFPVRRPERAGLRDKRQAVGGRAGVPALLCPAVPLPWGRADLRAPLQWRFTETCWGVRQSSAGETSGALLQGVGVWQPGQQHFLLPISR